MSLRWIDDGLDSIAETAANYWYVEQCKYLYAVYYIYYKEGEGRHWGGVLILRDDEDIPEGYQLARPERVSYAWEKLQARRFIRETIARLPILPPER